MTDAELDALVALGEALACDCDDTDGWEGGAPTIRDLIAALTTLRKQRDELREVLRPFAKAYEDQGDGPDFEDRHDLWENPAALEVTIGDLRRARQTLSNMEGE